MKKIKLNKTYRKKSKNLQELGLDRVLKLEIKVWSIKGDINKLYFIKISGFYSVKDHVEDKNNSLEWENICISQTASI